jgi:hypothetical protein
VDNWHQYVNRSGVDFHDAGKFVLGRECLVVMAGFSFTSDIPIIWIAQAKKLV